MDTNQNSQNDEIEVKCRYLVSACCGEANGYTVVEYSRDLKPDDIPYLAGYLKKQLFPNEPVKMRVIILSIFAFKPEFYKNGQLYSGE